MRRIVGASPRALFLRCVEINLHIGVWKHHGPDVTAFHDDAASLAVTALTGDEDLTHAWKPRYRRGRLVHVRRSNRTRHVVAVDRHEVALHADCRVARDAGHAGFIVERHAIVRRHPGHRAVHRAGIDMAIAKTLRQRARHSALPRARGSVDRDDQLLHL
jgi:hypothetical protein